MALTLACSETYHKVERKIGLLIQTFHTYSHFSRPSFRAFVILNSRRCSLRSVFFILFAGRF